MPDIQELHSDVEPAQNGDELLGSRGTRLLPTRPTSEGPASKAVTTVEFSNYIPPRLY